ncbi:MAG: alpha/beta hydrolase [Symplocastrum torsivum CPER-KK1]|jgi:pimeloyl-ACP methyl ester carboxylesterase|uniref:Alpha/beta hydrolase n=1 Tax=Symplocastrum torsivum CPER-KK1 TaxID=450513 RepID=A0A951PNC4_9CYAN|nr:alpha/beta hydrolase [Symplocastrum torsivum CPER-KK1]
MSLFCLVHGAYCGAWCWDLLIPELEARGHKAVAMDLPIEEPEAGAIRYAEVVLQALQGISDDVILVGHSMSGLVIPVVASQHPVRKLVYLAGGIPKVGTSVVERISHGDESDMFNSAAPNKDASEDNALAMELLFHDCKPEVAQWAIPKLRYQASGLVFSEISPLQTMPEVESAYIVCTEDRTFTSVWSKRAAREILGVDAIALQSGHCPQLSRPVELADVLDSITQVDNTEAA